MRTKTLAISLLVPALILAACGRLNDGGAGATSGGSGSDGSDAIDHPTGADELVLRMETGGGFVPASYTLKSVPGFSLYGDGRVVVEGPVVEIYPGPALPNLQVFRLTEDGVRSILQAAEAAGLLGADASYDYPCIADAPTTTFTVVAEGATHTVSAYALGMDQGTASCPGTEVEPRTKLQDFSQRLGDLERWLPQGSVGGSEPYTPTAMRVFVQSYQGDGQLQEPQVEWPLGDPLATFGQPDPNLPDTRCGVVDAGGLDALLAKADRANELTPWTSDGTEYGLIFRPLLPDEGGC